MAQPSDANGASEPAVFKGMVGTRVIVEPEGLGERFNTTVSGWDRGKYFLINVPPGAGGRTALKTGTTVIVRYLDPDGMICGFTATVLGLVNAPVRLAILDYPRRIVSVSLRKADRMHTFLPATVALEGVRFPGYIVNLSAAGCRFVPATSHGLPSDYRDNMDAQVDFSLFDHEERALSSPGQVRRITHDNENVYFGIEFKNTATEFQDAVAGYVETLKKYIGDL